MSLPRPLPYQWANRRHDKNENLEDGWGAYKGRSNLSKNENIEESPNWLLDKTWVKGIRQHLHK